MVLKRLITLGASHGLADATTGFMLFSLPGFNLWGKITAAVVFGLFAFGLQPLAGFVTDRYVGARMAVGVGLGLIGAGALLGLIVPIAGLIVMGLGSSFFHVGAGAASIRLTPNKSYGPGIFTAPGVLGLAIGASCALVGIPILIVLLVAVAVSIGLNLMWLPSSKTFLLHKSSLKLSGEWVVILLLSLVLLVTIRSSIWDSFQKPEISIAIFLGLALVAALGKLLGSFLADKIGSVAFVITVGVVSAIGLYLSHASVWWLLIGVLALQSTTPFILMIVGRLVNKNIALATGLILGLAIAFGGLVKLTFHSYNLSVLAVAAAIIVTVGLLLVLKRSQIA